MIYNCDCIEGARKYFVDESVGLMISDPPFGICETTFDKHYNRDENVVIEGYVEAPEDYYQFTLDWMKESKRVLKNNGSMYIISGWTNSDIIGRVIRDIGLNLINKIIWHFPFGVSTKKKFVTSHYEIFYVSKSKNADVVFNTNCRYPFRDSNETSSLLYKDLQSVWIINKEYQAGKIKNKNKLPEELIKKMIAYSSNENDVVCDFFLGNFTTAIVAKKMNRIPAGFELNPKSFDINLSVLDKIVAGSDIITIDSNVPDNCGQKITLNIAHAICKSYNDKHIASPGKSKREIVSELSSEYGRGIFSIQNIIEKYGNGIISEKLIQEKEGDLFTPDGDFLLDK